MAENAGRWALDFVRQNATAMPRLREALPNLLSALASVALYGDDWALVVELAVALNDPMQRAGHWRDWQPYLERLINIVRQQPGRTGKFVLLLGLGDALALRGESQAAINWLEQAIVELSPSREEVDIGAARELHPEWFRAYCRLAECWINLGDVAKATHYLQTAHRIARQRKDEYARLIITGQLGRLYIPLGEWLTAERYFNAALAIARERQDKAQQLSNLYHISEVYFRLGRVEAERACLDEALGLCRQLGERSGEGMVLMRLSDWQRRSGEQEAAKRNLEQALSIQREVNHPVKQAQALAALSRFYMDKGNCDRAQAYLAEALELLADQAAPYAYGLVYQRLSELFQLRGEVEPARQACQLSREYYLQGGEVYLAKLVGGCISG